MIDPLRRKITGEAYAESLRRREKTEQAKGGPARTGGAADEASKSEQVDVSDKAMLMSRIQRALAEIADVRADLIQEIKERIARDEYHVDGEVVADKVIREALKEMKSLRRG